MTATPGTELIAVHELDTADVVRWRAWQCAEERLRAPTLSIAYLAILAANRSDVRIARLTSAVGIAFLGVHVANARWSAAGLLFNDWQALIRDPEAGPDASYLAELPDLTVGSWRPDAPLPTEAGRLHPSVGYAVRLDDGLEAYLLDRRAHALDHLKKIRRRLRALEEAHGPVRLVWPDPSDAARRQLLAWKSTQFRRTGRHDILSSRWIQAFIASAFASDHQDCRAELASLYAGDTLVAAEIGFTGLGVNQSWLAAYDPDHARFGPGTLLLQKIIEAAPARAITRIDLGPGHGGYKQYFANETYTALTGRLTSAPAGGRARDLAAFSSWAERKRFPGAELPGRVLRRYAMIAACEPSVLGRARGVLTALGDAARPSRPAS